MSLQQFTGMLPHSGHAPAETGDSEKTPRPAPQPATAPEPSLAGHLRADFTNALRPLRLPGRDRRRGRLDEQATAERLARGDLREAVFSVTPAPWLDVSLATR